MIAIRDVSQGLQDKDGDGAMKIHGEAYWAARRAALEAELRNRRIAAGMAQMQPPPRRDRMAGILAGGLLLVSVTLVVVSLVGLIRVFVGAGS